ncbi:MAG: AtpZ/AtpI family protein [Lachnospiraceae bacterium]
MDKNRKEIVNCIFLIAQIAIVMMVSLCVGGFLGWLVGKWFHFKLAILIGLVLGAAAGYRSVYDMVKRYMKDPQPPEIPRKPSEDEIRRKKAEEEFDRWKQEKQSDDR